MRKSSNFEDNQQSCCRKERWLNMGRLSTFLLCVTFVVSSFIFYPPNPFKAMIGPKLLSIKPHEPGKQKHEESTSNFSGILQDTVVMDSETQKPDESTNNLTGSLQDAIVIDFEKQKQDESTGNLTGSLQDTIMMDSEKQKQDESTSKLSGIFQDTIVMDSEKQKQDQSASNLPGILQDTIVMDSYDKDCDLFKGHWVPDARGSLYTNTSCSTIPSSKNCFMQGRPDKDFLNWRWRPNQCELQRFDPKKFLGLVRGKKMNFVGDSVARNHMESLLCLLSQEETPKDVYKDSEDRNRVWFFPNHKFTLSTSWTKFLVAGSERTDENNTGIGIFDLNIDELEPSWIRDLTETDIAVVSAAHWFFRPIVLHGSNKTLGCIFCNIQNLKQLNPVSAFSLVFASVFDHIMNCKNCKNGLVTILRTFSPSHFENGTWNTGGSCRRTSPLRENEIDLKSNEMKFRGAQVREFERALRIKDKKKKKKQFAVMDATEAMLMRPDGHPDEYWGNKWMKGYNDCTHWCLPGPIDVWNEFLMAILRRII